MILNFKINCIIDNYAVDKLLVKNKRLVKEGAMSHLRRFIRIAS